MAKLKIFTFPDLVLAKKAAPIVTIDKTKWRLADDMLETMYHAPGVGLAANQVGILERILVIDTEFEMEDIAEGEPLPEDLPKDAEVAEGVIIHSKKPKIIINPKIISHEGTSTLKEGCLSVPDFSHEVKRYEKVKIEYQTIDGLTKTLAADGILAIAIQHEMDHLDGKLFIDRLSALKKEMIRKKLKQARLEREEDERDFGEAALMPADKKKKEL